MCTHDETPPRIYVQRSLHHSLVKAVTAMPYTLNRPAVCGIQILSPATVVSQPIVGSQSSISAPSRASIVSVLTDVNYSAMKLHFLACLLIFQDKVANCVSMCGFLLLVYVCFGQFTIAQSPHSLHSFGFVIYLSSFI